MSQDPELLLENSTWRATLDGHRDRRLPSVRNAGNVLAPRLGVKLSFRLPPTANAAKRGRGDSPHVRTDPPYGARVRSSPEAKRRLERSAARALAGARRAGSLPQILRPRRHVDGSRRHDSFHGHAGRAVSRTQFLVTGVLGPHSNAHGPNEFLHIDYAKRLTAAVAQVMASHRRTATRAEGSERSPAGGRPRGLRAAQPPRAVSTTGRQVPGEVGEHVGLQCAVRLGSSVHLHRSADR